MLTKKMIVGHGIDTVSASRIERLLNEYGAVFLSKIYTIPEITYCNVRNDNTRHERYAALWAAKEATMKALGTGNRQGVHFSDIEIRHESTGKPYVNLYSAARLKANSLGVENIVVSMTHEEGLSQASVIIEKY